MDPEIKVESNDNISTNIKIEPGLDIYDESENLPANSRENGIMDMPCEAIFEFLNLFEKEELLWNTAHPLHRNRQEVLQSWTRIQQQFSIESRIEELKRKKDSLMATFRPLYRKVKAKEKLKNEVYKPSWFAYNKMASFLIPAYEQNRVKLNADLITEELPLIPDLIETNINSPNDNETSNNATINMSNINMGEPMSTDLIDGNDSVEKLIEDDEFDIFGQYIGSQLKKIPLSTALEAQDHIQTYVHQIRMQYLKQL